MKSWAMNCCSFSTAEVEFLWFDMRWMIGLGPSSIMLSLHVSIWHQVQDTESLVINCKQYMDTGQDDCWRVFMKSMMLPCKTKHVDGQKTRAHCRYWLRDSALDSFDVCVCVCQTFYCHLPSSMITTALRLLFGGDHTKMQDPSLGTTP